MQRGECQLTITSARENASPTVYERHRKESDPRASIPEIIRRGREYGILKDDTLVDRTTVYRVAKRLGPSLARRKGGKDRDSRRFAYPHRLDMVLSDGKHFRAGAKRARRVAYFFLDVWLLRDAFMALT